MRFFLIHTKSKSAFYCIYMQLTAVKGHAFVELVIWRDLLYTLLYKVNMSSNLM